MSDIVRIRAADGRRAFVTPKGPELTREFSSQVLTEFLRTQVDDGDAELDDELKTTADKEVINDSKKG